MKKILFLFILLFMTANSKPMDFKYVGNGGNCIGCEWTAAEGEITQDTPKKLKEYIESWATKGNGFIPKIVFNSPGGNLLAGLEMGKILREYKVQAGIGDTIKDDYGYHDLKDNGGICVSACAYAFLGATNREIYGKDKLGFHQFYDEKAMKGFSKKQFSGNDRMWDQYTTGLIVEYLLSMNIDLSLYSLISKTPPDSIYYLNKEEIAKFEIKTDFKSSTPWTLKAYDKGLVAEIVTRDIYKTVGRLYSTRNNKYYFTVIYNGQDFESQKKHLEKIYSMFDLRLSTGGNEKYKILKTDYYLSKDKKRMTLVFQISKKIAELLGRANRIHLQGYNSDGSYPARVYQPNFDYVSFMNIVGDKRLAQIALKNPI